MADNTKAVQNLAAKIKASQPRLSHRQVMQKAAETVRKTERKKG